MIEAHVICDSVSTEGHRPLTFKLRYPKFIHGEFMTHRVISRNASSSRAVPTRKLLEEVRSDALRAAPVWWGKDQGGMQARAELAGEELAAVKDLWETAADCAAVLAEAMAKVGAHKQIVNRLLEPFSHINVVATATEWDNFFGLRLHADAQPEMRALAEAMWAAREASTPRTLQPGEWHLPFVGYVNEQGELEASVNEGDDGAWPIALLKSAERTGLGLLGVATRVSVARCARVSYESFETGRRSTIEEDLKLYERLVGSQPLHASPAEHQATPDRLVKNGRGGDYWDHPWQHGNLRGWRQFRKTLPGEAVAPLPEGYND